MGTYVVVVDDDESIRESLPDFIRLFGHEAEAFSSGQSATRRAAVIGGALIRPYDPDIAACRPLNLESSR